MALRDTWHRALVYFGLAEDHDYGPEYEEDFEPDQETPPKKKAKGLHAHEKKLKPIRFCSRRSVSLYKLFSGTGRFSAIALARIASFCYGQRM